MQRRTLLKGAAVGGVAVLGAGFWALPTGTAPAARSLEGARSVLTGFQGKALVSIQGWTRRKCSTIAHRASSTPWTATRS